MTDRIRACGIVTRVRPPATLGGVPAGLPSFLGWWFRGGVSVPGRPRRL